MKYCSQCGNPLEDDMLFCPRCGAKHRYGAQTIADTTEPVLEKNKNSGEYKIPSSRKTPPPSKRTSSPDLTEKIISFLFNALKFFFEFCGKLFKKCFDLWKKLSNRSRFIVIGIFILILFLIILVNSVCFHQWRDATCTTPKICLRCSETKGSSLGHIWIDADCDNAKTCSVCGRTSGNAFGHNWVGTSCIEDGSCTVCGKTQKAFGHNWIPADCINPKYCSVCKTTEGEPSGHEWVDANCENAKTCYGCGLTEGEALGHNWIEATCHTPRTCSNCEKTLGHKLGHKYSSWKVSKKSTCGSDGIEKSSCDRCGESSERKISKTGQHTYGEWEINVAPACTKEGTKTKTCTVCKDKISEKIAATGHVFEESVIKEATYYSPGTFGERCKECGYSTGKPTEFYMYNKIKLSTIFSEYRKNEIAADDKFDDMYIEFTATIDEINRDKLFSDETIVFEIGNGTWWEDRVVCELTEREQIEIIKTLAVGSKVTVCGKISFYSKSDLYMTLYVKINEIK